MKQLLLVFIGGGLGSTVRFLIGKALNSSQNTLPFATVTVNVLGSLLIGIILGLATKHHTISQNHTLLLVTGFCGGLTTFSTFAYENHLFLKSGNIPLFIIYTVGSFFVALIAVMVGVYLAKYL